MSRNEIQTCRELIEPALLEIGDELGPFPLPRDGVVAAS